MTTVKFDKSVKYQGVRYDAHEAFKVEDADVDALRAAGATVLAVDTGDDTKSEDADENNDSQSEEDSVEDIATLKEELLEYSVPELITFAKERGIDLQKKTRKADIYNIIVASL